MSDASRRKLLKSIAAGSGAIVAGKSLPESWSKPVVDSVMLPAHAQTSGLPNEFAGDAIVEDRDITAITRDGAMMASLAGSLIPDAYAGGPSIGESNGYICATVNDNGVDVTFQNRANRTRRQGLLPKTGVGSLDNVMVGENCRPAANNCEDSEDFVFDAEVTDITEDYIELVLYPCDRLPYSVRVGVGTCTMPDLRACEPD